MSVMCYDYVYFYSCYVADLCNTEVLAKKNRR